MDYTRMNSIRSPGNGMYQNDFISSFRNGRRNRFPSSQYNFDNLPLVCDSGISSYSNWLITMCNVSNRFLFSYSASVSRHNRERWNRLRSENFSRDVVCWDNAWNSPHPRGPRNYQHFSTGRINPQPGISRDRRVYRQEVSIDSRPGTSGESRDSQRSVSMQSGNLRIGISGESRGSQQSVPMEPIDSQQSVPMEPIDSQLCTMGELRVVSMRSLQNPQQSISRDPRVYQKEIPIESVNSQPGISRESRDSQLCNIGESRVVPMESLRNSRQVTVVRSTDISTGGNSQQSTSKFLSPVSTGPNERSGMSGMRSGKRENCASGNKPRQEPRLIFECKEEETIRKDFEDMFVRGGREDEERMPQEIRWLRKKMSTVMFAPNKGLLAPAAAFKVLKSLFPDLEYNERISSSHEDNDASASVDFVISEKNFQGEGKTLQEAKNNAAEKCLRYLYFYQLMELRHFAFDKDSKNMSTVDVAVIDNEAESIVTNVESEDNFSVEDSKDEVFVRGEAVKGLFDELLTSIKDDDAQDCNTKFPFGHLICFALDKLIQDWCDNFDGPLAGPTSDADVKFKKPAQESSKLNKTPRPLPDIAEEGVEKIEANTKKHGSGTETKILEFRNSTKPEEPVTAGSKDVPESVKGQNGELFTSSINTLSKNQSSDKHLGSVTQNPSLLNNYNNFADFKFTIKNTKAFCNITLKSREEKGTKDSDNAINSEDNRQVSSLLNVDIIKPTPKCKESVGNDSKTDTAKIKVSSLLDVDIIKPAPKCKESVGNDSKTDTAKMKVSDLLDVDRKPNPRCKKSFGNNSETDTAKIKVSPLLDVERKPAPNCKESVGRNSRKIKREKVSSLFAKKNCGIRKTVSEAKFENRRVRFRRGGGRYVQNKSYTDLDSPCRTERNSGNRQGSRPNSNAITRCGSVMFDNRAVLDYETEFFDDIYQNTPVDNEEGVKKLKRDKTVNIKKRRRNNSTSRKDVKRKMAKKEDVPLSKPSGSCDTPETSGPRRKPETQICSETSHGKCEEHTQIRKISQFSVKGLQDGRPNIIIERHWRIEDSCDITTSGTQTIDTASPSYETPLSASQIPVGSNATVENHSNKKITTTKDIRTPLEEVTHESQDNVCSSTMIHEDSNKDRTTSNIPDGVSSNTDSTNMFLITDDDSKAEGTTEALTVLKDDRPRPIKRKFRNRDRVTSDTNLIDDHSKKLRSTSNIKPIHINRPRVSSNTKKIDDVPKTEGKTSDSNKGPHENHVQVSLNTTIIDGGSQAEGKTSDSNKGTRENHAQTNTSNSKKGTRENHVLDTYDDNSKPEGTKTEINPKGSIPKSNESTLENQPNTTAHEDSMREGEDSITPNKGEARFLDYEALLKIITELPFDEIRPADGNKDIRVFKYTEKKTNILGTTRSTTEENAPAVGPVIDVDEDPIGRTGESSETPVIGRSSSEVDDTTEGKSVRIQVSDDDSDLEIVFDSCSERRALKTVPDETDNNKEGHQQVVGTKYKETKGSFDGEIPDPEVVDVGDPEELALKKKLERINEK